MLSVNCDHKYTAHALEINIIPYSGYTVRGLISAKLQFLCSAVISAFAISVKQSYTKSHGYIKIVTSGVEFCTIDSVIREYHVYKDTWYLSWYL